MKDGKSLVRAGDNRYHAIFLTDGDALFVNPSSLAVALAALDAQATINGPKGERTIKVEELYQVPKRETDSELTLAPGEVLTKVMIPAVKGKNGAYEARQKQAQDWPLVLASVKRCDGRGHGLGCQDRALRAWHRSPGGARRPRGRSPASGSRPKPPPPPARPPRKAPPRCR